MKKSIVWGTCWFNEELDTLINFYISSLKSLKKLNVNVIPIIFVAKLNCDKNEIEKIKSRINDVIILENTTDIFPNKNYGVALITNKANEINSDYVAIVDCDWDILESNSFIDNTVKKLISNNCDILIPNIKDASGRSNLLIGKTIINLFYPEYKNTLLTAFPGSLIAKTSKMYVIVNDFNYHFDWGGEWDIISLSIKNNFKICSFEVNVKNTRHRMNNSKMNDSFQIWRALFLNDDILKRFNNLKKCRISINKNTKLKQKLSSKKYSLLEMINVIMEENPSDTELQILYMILYPIGFLSGELTEIPYIEDKKTPYNKEELNNVIDIALYCAKIALMDLDINKINIKSENIQGKFLSQWNKEKQNMALKNYKENN